MTRTVTIAATQMACTWDRAANLDTAERLVREAAAQGAQVILLQELFETPYFCQTQKGEHLLLARPLGENPAIARFRDVARELGVVLPISVYELAGQARFNTTVVIDADGAVLGHYRKSHIPDGPGYCEKFYFSPGDTGFRAWDTAYARIGVGICWDQWFPEAARAMALAGAEILLYPTAIGSEPESPDLDSRDHWRRAQQGHAASNLMPVAASNRVGVETQDDSEITFYGSSFVTDAAGGMLADLPRSGNGVGVASFDLDELAAARAEWGLFRDRRPALYGALGTLDGIS